MLSVDALGQLHVLGLCLGVIQSIFSVEYRIESNKSFFVSVDFH